MKKQQPTYVDGYVLVIKKKNLAEYKKVATEAAAMWMKYGALSYRECVGDDMTPEMGKYGMLRFPDLIKAKKDEVVLFSYVEYKSKAHRDAVNKQINKDMTEYEKDHPDHMKDMPFDHDRMAFGGFKVFVNG